MRLFTTLAVKSLIKEAQNIGNMHGRNHLGELSQQDLTSVVNADWFRSQLRAAYDAAAADVGEKKALKEAIRAARSQADAVYWASTKNSNTGHVQDSAERSIRMMLDL